jgi:hypothetical protein
MRIKILISGGQRLFQQHRPIAEIKIAQSRPGPDLAEVSKERIRQPVAGAYGSSRWVEQVGNLSKKCGSGEPSGRLAGLIKCRLIAYGRRSANPEKLAAEDLNKTTRFQAHDFGRDRRHVHRRT